MIFEVAAATCQEGMEPFIERFMVELFLLKWYQRNKPERVKWRINPTNIVKRTDKLAHRYE